MANWIDVSIVIIDSYIHSIRSVCLFFVIFFLKISIRIFFIQYIDILPLVEFEINISDEDFRKILDANSDGSQMPSLDRQSRRTSVALVNDSQVFTNDSLSIDDNDRHKIDSEQMINFGDEINSVTNVAILNEKHLNKLNRSNVIIASNRYYLNMMPHIGIVACPFCHKVCLSVFTMITGLMFFFLTIIKTKIQNLNITVFL